MFFVKTIYTKSLIKPAKSELQSRARDVHNLTRIHELMSLVRQQHFIDLDSITSIGTETKFRRKKAVELTIIALNCISCW